MTKKNPFIADIEKTRLEANLAQYKAFYATLPMRLIQLMAQAEKLGVRYLVFSHEDSYYVSFIELNEYNEEEELTVSLNNLESTVIPTAEYSSLRHYTTQINDFEQIVDFLTLKKIDKETQEHQDLVRRQAISKLDEDELEALRIHFRSMP